MTDTCDIASRYSAPSVGQFLALFVNIVVQIFISFVAVYMTYLCVKLKFQKTAFHAWFCTIGFCCLMAEGVMTFYEGNALTHPFDNDTKTTIHLVLLAVGGLMGIIGSVHKIQAKKQHFKTVHGKVGLFATCLCFFSMTSGLASLYIEESIKPIHTIIGLTVFITGMWAQYTGYETGFFNRNVDFEMKWLFKYLAIVIVVLCCISPVRTVLTLFLSWL